MFITALLLAPLVELHSEEPRDTMPEAEDFVQADALEAV